ncbi:MAG: endosialidase [Clostridium sp.]|nr:endosialidase [Clostridium sp.]MBP3214750.1 endosialidase [Clostridium sp.]MBQ4149624.1 endosialidase [Clostridium sp.]MBQ5421935.1 endosialidase [Clostridium sp.]HAE80514.1 endosialidase [Lachnoclostridium sp.]
MSGIKELLRVEADGAISFGDYELEEKKKLADFEYQGDLYKVKTFREITKLERNGMFVYESVPGTAVTGFEVRDSSVEFSVESDRDVQITLQMEEDRDYAIYMDDVAAGSMRTNLSGKLVLSVEMNGEKPVRIRVVAR